MPKRTEPVSEWKPYTTEKSPSGGRSLREYEMLLGFNRQDLNGHTILDLGSSAEDYFYRDLKKEEALKTKVISLNPDLSLGESSVATSTYLAQHKRFDTPNTHYIAAIGQHMPLKNKSVDRIFALNSVSKYSNDSAATNKWAAECFRVLKNGGEALFLHDYHNYVKEEQLKTEYNSYLDKCREMALILEKKGFKVVVEEVDMSQFSDFNQSNLPKPFLRIKAKKE